MVISDGLHRTPSQQLRHQANILEQKEKDVLYMKYVLNKLKEYIKQQRKNEPEKK